MLQNNEELKNELKALREYVDGLLMLVLFILTAILVGAYTTNGTIFTVSGTLTIVAFIKIIRISLKLKSLSKD